MSTLEAALRGGTVVILLLRVALDAGLLGRSRLSRYSMLFNLGVAAFVINSAPGFWLLDPRLRLPLLGLGNATPAAFWIMAAAVFDDEFRARWYHALAWLWLAAVAWWEISSRWPAVPAIHEASSLLFVLFGVWHALAGRAGDLVERRRGFRVEFAICTALYVTFIIVSQRIWPNSLDKAPFSLINAIGLVGLTFLFAWQRLSLSAREELTPAVPQAGPAPLVPNEPKTPPAAGQDTALLEALRKLMTEGKAYREDGLSIAALAQSLGVQEHRLRRLINGQLGHRNFNAFVNGYRLADAMAALADPGQDGVPILTIALDAGFGSIGPFNRAFKAHTGLTPTEYRRARLISEAFDVDPVKDTEGRALPEPAKGQKPL